MKLKKLLFRLGAIMYVLTGLGHTSGGNFFSSGLITISNKSATRTLMENANVEFLVFSSDVYKIFTGYHFTFGIMIFAFGAINLLYARLDIDKVLQDKPIMFLNIFISLIMAVLWYTTTFFLPTIEMTISFICFTLAFLMRNS